MAAVFATQENMLHVIASCACRGISGIIGVRKISWMHDVIRMKLLVCAHLFDGREFRFEYDPHGDRAEQEEIIRAKALLELTE